MSRQSGLALALGVLLLGMTGCSGQESAQDQAAGTSAQATTAASDPMTEQTSPLPPPPPPPPTPVVAGGPCPYLEKGYVEATVGQRLGRVETVTLDGQPAPDCIFYRPDGTPAVTIDFTPYADPVAAQNAALALVSNSANPVTDIGDYGGVIVSAGQTLLAFTIGPLLIAVITNQESSRQARELALTVLGALP